LFKSDIFISSPFFIFSANILNSFEFKKLFGLLGSILFDNFSFNSGVKGIPIDFSITVIVLSFTSFIFSGDKFFITHSTFSAASLS